MSSATSQARRAHLAATVAPEDLKCGDFVAALNEIVELPSFLWFCETPSSSSEHLIRIKCCAEEAGTPLRVEAICLPFVFLQAPNRRYDTVDVRQVELVRLDRRYARLVWKQLRKRAAHTRCGAIS